MYVQQDVSRAGEVRPGMSSAQVARVMGENPIRSEFSDGVMEWHYCRTGRLDPVDQMVALWFVDDALIESRLLFRNASRY
jgi:hypothetical protein